MKKGERLLSFSCLPAGTATVVVGIALGLAGSAAFRATLGLVLEAFFLVEVLFAFGKDELRSTILAGQCLVSHCENTSSFIIWNESFLGTTLHESGGGCQKTNQSIPYISRAVPTITRRKNVCKRMTIIFSKISVIDFSGIPDVRCFPLQGAVRECCLVRILPE
jgi:hypothetical protein